MKQVKIRDKEYNCSNKVYYHIQGLESENRVISMELLGHENNELQQQKEIERLSIELNQCMIERNNYLSRNEKAIEYIEEYQEVLKEHNGDWLNYQDGFKPHLLDILKGVDKG